MSSLAHRQERLKRGVSAEILRFIETYKQEWQPGDEVFEPGVGEGRNLLAFQKLGMKVHGIDFDPDAVRISKQTLGDEADIRQGSFSETLPYADNSMKVVISQSALQNARTIEDAEKAFIEISRILQSITGLFFFRENRIPRHIDAKRERRLAYFTQEELADLTAKANLRIESQNLEERDDPDRVGGKRKIWTILFRKPVNS